MIEAKFKEYGKIWFMYDNGTENFTENRFYLKYFSSLYFRCEEVPYHVKRAAKELEKELIDKRWSRNAYHIIQFKEAYQYYVPQSINEIQDDINRGIMKPLIVHRINEGDTFIFKFNYDGELQCWEHMIDS